MSEDLQNDGAEVTLAWPDDPEREYYSEYYGHEDAPLATAHIMRNKDTSHTLCGKWAATGSVDWQWHTVAEDEFDPDVWDSESGEDAYPRLCKRCLASYRRKTKVRWAR